jgi:DNA-binding SARP family transcriptional activator
MRAYRRIGTPGPVACHEGDRTPIILFCSHGVHVSTSASKPPLIVRGGCCSLYLAAAALIGKESRMDTNHVDWLGRHIGNVDAPVVHLFGGPYITVASDRREIPEGSKQLLAFVALRRRRVERCRAAGALWPSGDEGRAAGNLRSALWRLRRAGIEVLVADKWSLALRTEVVVDLHVMDRLVTRLIDGTAVGDDLVVLTSWADALDFLPGWYDDWALMERERLRQRVLHALEALSRKLAGLGRFADAVEAAMLATSAEPLRESAQRTLIEAFVAEGNLCEARRSCQAYRDLVRRELGVDPSRDLLTLLRVPEKGPQATTSRSAVRAV